MDKWRKQQRKKELAKNKERRQEARTAAAQRKDSDALRAERAALERIKDAPHVPGPNGPRLDKIEDKLRWYDKQIEARTALEASDSKDGRRTVTTSTRTKPTSTMYAVGAEWERKPEDSVYWHPTLNPSGKPPPGKPQKWKMGVEATSGAVDAGRALPLASGSGRMDESESEEDAMPPPSGPPPRVELIIPAAPPNAGEVKGEDEDEEPLPPPSGPPPPEEEEDEEDEGEGSDSDALPPPPTAPPALEDEKVDVKAVAPPMVTTTTTVTRVPIAGAPTRQTYAPRAQPPPARRPGNSGFFAAPRAVTPRAPVDPSTFTKSAAPTVTPTIRAENNAALKALVPASVRVRRRDAPEPKRRRVVSTPAVNAAPEVNSTAQDEKYLSFLDEMSSLGAFEES